MWLSDVFDFVKLVWHFRTIFWHRAEFFQKESNAKVLATLLQSRGAFFVKLGQWLGQRPDIIPQSFCAELKRLQVDAPKHSWAETLQVCNNIDLHKYMVFLDKDAKTGDPIAISSGSIAQVYRIETTRALYIELHNLLKGNSVFLDLPESKDDTVLPSVFKVCHPNVAETFARSLKTITQLYLFAQKIMGKNSPLAMINIHDVAATEMQRQCDLLCEAKHGQQLRKNFIGNPYVAIPYVYLGTTQFLCEEYIGNAIFYDEIGTTKDKTAYTNDDEKQTTRLLAKEITMAAYLQMILHNGLSHGDCHCGNILYELKPKSRAIYQQQLADMESHMVAGMPLRVAPVEICVWFLDFGIVVDVDDNLRTTMLELTVSINASDSKLLARAFERVLMDRDKLTPEALQKFEDDCEKTNRLLREKDSVGRGSSIQDQILVVVENFRVHNLRIEAAALRVIISWLLIDENTPVLGHDDTLPDNTVRWINMEDTQNVFHLHEVTSYIIGARLARVFDQKNRKKGDSPRLVAPDLSAMQRRRDEKRDNALLLLNVSGNNNNDDDEIVLRDQTWRKNSQHLSNDHVSLLGANSERAPLLGAKRKKKRVQLE